jgi:hypothetical protein
MLFFQHARRWKKEAMTPCDRLLAEAKAVKNGAFAISDVFVEVRTPIPAPGP